MKAMASLSSRWRPKSITTRSKSSSRVLSLSSHHTTIKVSMSTSISPTVDTQIIIQITPPIVCHKMHILYSISRKSLKKRRVRMRKTRISSERSICRSWPSYKLRSGRSMIAFMALIHRFASVSWSRLSMSTRCRKRCRRSSRSNRKSRER